MNILKNYANNLVLEDEYKYTRYVKKSYILPCYDEKKETTHILFSIYYTNYTYEIYVEGIKIEKLENGFKKSFSSCKSMKLVLPYKSYKFSKNKFDSAFEFIKTNIYSLIETFCDKNKNIYVD